MSVGKCYTIQDSGEQKAPLPLVPIPDYWTWTKSNFQKKCFFWLNPYKTEVMITSLIEMLEIPNFGHMTTPTL